jgi:regulator of protease activity HflC (stomatin/prohibitin superfamily)
LTNFDLYGIIIVPKERKVLNMAKSKKQLHEGIRNKYMKMIVDFLEEEGEEILRTKSNEIAIPTVDEDNNDEWCVITFKVPTGSRDDGEAYDGYGMADEYTAKEADKAEKAAKAKAEKEKKIARDKAQREAKAKAKAEHEATKGRATPRNAEEALARMMGNYEEGE